MKTITTVAVLLAVAVCASAQTALAQTKKKSAATRATQAVTIPKDAVRNENGSYNYTDKEGKKWIYANSPFGVIKTAAPEGSATAAPVKAASSARAIDKGDTVEFERDSPFGKVKWEKKKSELTDEERGILNGQAQSQTAKPDTK